MIFHVIKCIYFYFLQAKHMAGKTKHKSVVDGTDDGGSPTTAQRSTNQRLSRASYTSQASTGSTGSTGDASAGGSAQYNSISALRDAFNSGELRSYGSPVMTLKETIDNHYNQSSQSNHGNGGQGGGLNAHGGGSGFGSPLRNSYTDSYLQPTPSSSSSSPEEKDDNQVN